MKRNSVLILGLLMTIRLFPQNIKNNYELGYYYDINQQRIDGYFDVGYAPKKELKMTFNIGNDYAPGYYYDLKNNKISGLLKYAQSDPFFQFKEDGNSKGKKIRPDQCTGFVIGLDSFAVIQNFEYETGIGGSRIYDRKYAEVMDKFNGLTFYKYTVMGLQKPVYTYMFKADTSGNYVSFPKIRVEFDKMSLSVFGSVKMMKDRIEKDKYKYDELPVMIKLLKYKYMYDQGQHIFYNSSWDEIDDSAKSAYYADIESVTDSLFYLKYYFTNGTPIYEGGFTSFYPHKKTGKFTWYYPEGGIRKIIVYKDDSPEKIAMYYRNGGIHYEYKIVDKENYYTKVLDPQGKEILDNYGSGTEHFYDSITKRTITYEFVNRKLTSAYYMGPDNQKIYQLCEYNAKPRALKSLQMMLDQFSYPLSSVKESHHGIVLVRCVVSPPGVNTPLKIIKGLDYACNSMVTDALSFMSTSKHWRPAHDQNGKVAEEVIIPIDFSINSFSYYRNNYYFNNVWMMQQQQMRMMNAAPQFKPVYH